MSVELSRAQVRTVDRLAAEEFGVPGVVLMENAGRGAAEVLLAQEITGLVLVCCGPGNNGGDGFVIARHLDNRLIPVKVALFAPADAYRNEARTNLEVLRRSGIELADFSRSTLDEEQFAAELDAAEWAVDALFGTGLENRPREPFDRAIELINDSQARVFAVDLPSGLDCDTGRPLGLAVRASHTATFVARKKGFQNPESEDYTGEVHVIDIGAPRKAIARAVAG